MKNENKKIAILQSNYIPWKGYFDLINRVDEFIFYDDVQYTKNDWRNRNQIKTSNGLIWLSIPIETKGHISENKKINEVKVINNSWRKKHWKSIQNSYSKSPYFKDYKEIFEQLYLSSNETYLSKINYKFILAINNILMINTKISYSSDYILEGDKNERIINLCKQANASKYISGPAAKDYINIELFKQENINLEWMDYSNYREYPQLYPPFVHNVSILDLIFNCGKDSLNYIIEENKNDKKMAEENY